MRNEGNSNEEVQNRPRISCEIGRVTKVSSENINSLEPGVYDVISTVGRFEVTPLGVFPANFITVRRIH